jgi:Protein of unknown function (DUF664)
MRSTLPGTDVYTRDLGTPTSRARQCRFNTLISTDGPITRIWSLPVVRHLADAERGWFRQCAAREDVPYLYWTEADNVADFNDIEAADAEADLDTYRREIVAARKAVGSKGLDDVVPFRWGGADRDIRWIYLHMIEEYARHNGHADLIRECIAGPSSARSARPWPPRQPRRMTGCLRGAGRTRSQA